MKDGITEVALSHFDWSPKDNWFSVSFNVGMNETTDVGVWFDALEAFAQKLPKVSVTDFQVKKSFKEKS
jgi:hypothetical protein